MASSPTGRQEPAPQFSAAGLRRVAGITVRAMAAVGFVAALTVGLSRYAAVNGTTAGFVYLVGVLLIATKAGLIEATIASIAAMLCFNFFFLPPVGTLTIADPQNWVALFAFLATSLTASHLSARAKRRAQEAEARRGEVERLYSLSRALLLTDATQPIAKQIVQQIAVTCGVQLVALYVRGSGEVYSAGFTDLDVESKLNESAVRSAVLRDEAIGLVVTPIRLGGEPIGSLALCGGGLSDAALQSLLNLIAIGLERANSQKAMTQAEVARQSEELKSTLLDAMAHEFKTPLTSIKAVTTDLLSRASGALPQNQHELITIVDDAADRLSKLVTDAIQLARIEGGTFRLNLGVHFPGSLVGGALRQMKSLLEEREISIDVGDNLPPVRVDAELIQVVLTHLLDNALKYSSSKSMITIAGHVEDGKVVITLSDQGPGIPSEERARVFDKFVRGKSQSHLKGTGMGLAIAREIMRAHGEDIWLASETKRGAEFCFSMPIATGSATP